MTRFTIPSIQNNPAPGKTAVTLEKARAAAVYGKQSYGTMYIWIETEEFGAQYKNMETAAGNTSNARIARNEAHREYCRLHGRTYGFLAENPTSGQPDIFQLIHLDWKQEETNVPEVPEVPAVQTPTPIISDRPRPT